MTAHTAPALAPASNEAPRSTVPISNTDWRSSIETTAFRRLIHTKRRVIAGLLGGSLGFFFLVLLLAGYARPFMTTKFLGPLNVGYALLIAIYLVSWGAALLYTLAAHRTFDPLSREAARDIQARRTAR